MAIFRKVHTSFWSDPFIEDLDRDQKLFYLYLITNDKTRQCGIYEITKKQIAYDLGYNIDTVSKHMAYFIKTGKIRYNEPTKELAIKNWLKYNSSTSPLVKKCIDKEFENVKDRVLIEYLYSTDTQSQEEQEEEREEEKETEPKINVYRSFLHLSISHEEFEKLKTDYHEHQVVSILDAIENYKDNKKYKSLYLTAKTWLQKEPKRQLAKRL